MPKNRYGLTVFPGGKNGEEERKGRAPAGGGLDLDRTAVGLDDGLGNRQAQTGRFIQVAVGTLARGIA